MKWILIALGSTINAIGVWYTNPFLGYIGVLIVYYGGLLIGRDYEKSKNKLEE